MSTYNHILFTKEDFKGQEDSTLSTNVIEGGLAVCKNCGEYEASLDSPCRVTCLICDGGPGNHCVCTCDKGIFPKANLSRLSTEEIKPQRGSREDLITEEEFEKAFSEALGTPLKKDKPNYFIEVPIVMLPRSLKVDELTPEDVKHRDAKDITLRACVSLLTFAFHFPNNPYPIVVNSKTHDIPLPYLKHAFALLLKYNLLEQTDSGFGDSSIRTNNDYTFKIIKSKTFIYTTYHAGVSDLRTNYATARSDSSKAIFEDVEARIGVNSIKRNGVYIAVYNREALDSILDVCYQLGYSINFKFGNY
jgi:hypothetical protein